VKAWWGFSFQFDGKKKGGACGMAPPVWGKEELGRGMFRRDWFGLFFLVASGGFGGAAAGACGGAVVADEAVLLMLPEEGDHGE